MTKKGQCFKLPYGFNLTKGYKMNEKYKDDIKIIFQVLSYLALYFMISRVDNPIVAIIAGGFCFIVWSFNIYDKIKYRNKKYLNEIRFPTQNDSYFKITSLTLGSMLTIGMIIWITLMKEFSFIPIIGLSAGLLILINGIIDVPNGQLKLENLKLKSIGMREEVELRIIKSIDIDSNQIIIRKENNSTVKIDKLQLNKKWTFKISKFLKDKLSTEEIKITCENTTKIQGDS